MKVVQQLLRFQPLIFGLGFLTPLTAQIIERAGWLPPFGLSPLVCGLLVGGGLGALANVRGRWL
jgi:hypothetical protein